MTKPSWQDFGTHDESAVPELWNGVVGAWAPCLGPTGSRLHDHSRRSNWGTLTNMDNATDWAINGGQYALDFDGSNDEVTTPAIMPAVAARSMSAWVLTRNVTGSQWFFGSGFLANNAAFIVGVQAGAWAVTQYGAVVFVTGAAANVWAHIVVVNAGTQWTIYANGIPVTGTMTTTLAAHPVFLGSYGGGGYWNGQIADVAIWQRALTAGEIMQLYQLGRGGMYQRRRRRAIYLPQDGFQAAWARGSNVMLGFNQP
jgi:hypothetical protein